MQSADPALASDADARAVDPLDAAADPVDDPSDDTDARPSVALERLHEKKPSP